MPSPFGLRQPCRLLLGAALACFSFAADGAISHTAPARTLPSPDLTPERIEMDTFFGGAAVRLRGEAPGAEEVIVTITGPEESQVFKRKARFGPIWLSSGQMHFSGIPSLWLVFSSRTIEALLPREPIEKHLLDREAILSRIHVDPAPEDASRFRSEYVEWKENFGLYAVKPDSIRLEPTGDGGVRYSLDFNWPKVAPPAQYRIEVYAVAGRRIAGVTEAPLEVVKVGLPQQIASLSTSRASLYGLGCILLAAAAGFGMDKLVSLLGGKRVRH